MNTIDDIRSIPIYYSTTISEDYLDEYGHMNVRWYATLWGQGASAFMKTLGLHFSEAIKEGRGNWVLRQIIDYNAEILAGDEISIHGRMVDYSDKCMHNMYWMVNETRDKVSSTSEVLVGYADLEARRLTSFPPELTDRFDARIVESDELGWLPETSGAILLSPSKR
jgi:acyl-CoA thioester hydrolase